MLGPHSVKGFIVYFRKCSIIFELFTPFAYFLVSCIKIRMLHHKVFQLFVHCIGAQPAQRKGTFTNYADRSRGALVKC